MFNACLVSLIDEEALRRFGDYSKFSREAFREYSNPAGAWRAVRNPRKNGKARKLDLVDMINISNALGMPLSTMFFQVEQKLKMGWRPERDGSFSPGKASGPEQREALSGGGAPLQEAVADGGK